MQNLQVYVNCMYSIYSILFYSILSYPIPSIDRSIYICMWRPVKERKRFRYRNMKSLWGDLAHGEIHNLPWQLPSNGYLCCFLFCNKQHKCMYIIYIYTCMYIYIYTDVISTSLIKTSWSIRWCCQHRKLTIIAI